MLPIVVPQVVGTWYSVDPAGNLNTTEDSPHWVNPDQGVSHTARRHALSRRAKKAIQITPTSVRESDAELGNGVVQFVIGPCGKSCGRRKAEYVQYEFFMGWRGEGNVVVETMEVTKRMRYIGFRRGRLTLMGTAGKGSSPEEASPACSSAFRTVVRPHPRNLAMADAPR